MLDGGDEGKGSRTCLSTWVEVGPALQWGVAPEHLLTWRTRAGRGDVKMWWGAHLPQGSGLTRPAQGQRVYKSMQNRHLEVSLRELNSALVLAFEQACISPSHPHTTTGTPPKHHAFSPHQPQECLAQPESQTLTPSLVSLQHVALSFRKTTLAHRSPLSGAWSVYQNSRY